MPCSAGVPETHWLTSSLFDEVSQIRSLLKQDEEQRAEARVTERKNRRAADQALPLLRKRWFTPPARLFLGGSLILGLGALFNQPLAILGGFMVMVLGIPVMYAIGALQIHRDWVGRRSESLSNARKVATLNDVLARQLSGFSRAALGYVADELAAFEARVDRRMVFFTGGRSGGLLTIAALMVAAAAGFDRMFSGDPAAYSAAVQHWSWVAFWVVFSASVAAVFGRHSINAVAEYSALLRQLSTAKETLEKEAKELHDATNLG